MELTPALEYVSDGVIGLDAQWHIAYVNPRAELLLRRRKHELVGENWWEVFPYLVGTTSEEQLRAAVRGTDAHRLRIFHPPLYAWHEVWVAPTAEGMLIVLRDVTDVTRMRQQEAVREAVREVVDQAPIAITILRGPDHRVELVNQLARQLLGGRDLEGQRIRSVLPELEGQGLFELLDQVYATGKAVEAKEVPVRYDRFGNGELYDGMFNIVYQPILDVNGIVSGVLSVSVEVTDLVAARQRLHGEGGAQG